jgi:hypothetical protein
VAYCLFRAIFKPPSFVSYLPALGQR